MNNIYRITWRYLESGNLHIGGTSLAANHGPVADDPHLAETLAKLFPDIEFVPEFFDKELNQWVPDDPQNYK